MRRGPGAAAPAEVCEAKGHGHSEKAPWGLGGWSPQALVCSRLNASDLCLIPKAVLPWPSSVILKELVVSQIGSLPSLLTC